MAEFHPFAWVFDEKHEGDLRIKYSYWEQREPDRDIQETAYSAKGYTIQNKETYSWSHALSDVMGALLRAGLDIVDYREYPFSVEETQFPGMYVDEEGYSRLPGDPIPLMFSLKAMKSNTF